MFSRRLRQLRLAKSYTLDQLAERTGGVITKQALSKYEKGLMRPSATVLNKLAYALDVKAAHLFVAPNINVEFIAYRKCSNVPKKEQARVEALITCALEDRVKLQEFIDTPKPVTAVRTKIGTAFENRLPINFFEAESFEEIEKAAEQIRDKWNLGFDPISNMVEILENNFVHVIQIDTTYKLDGVSAVAYDDKREIKAAAVTSRTGIPGERQRFNLAHELGHLMLKHSNIIDREKTASRFAGAFLAPAESIRGAVGFKRENISLEELRELKQIFGLSIAAILYRLYDLHVISKTYHKDWCVNLSRQGWKTNEVDKLEPEKSIWVRMAVLRGLSEGFLNHTEASRFLGETIKIDKPTSSTKRKDFLHLPIEERRRRLSEQATKASSEYLNDPAFRNIGGGDFVS